MSRSIHELKAVWEAHARHDPFWAILSAPAKKQRGWDTGEFFETGRREIRDLFGRMKELNIIPAGKKALDFGCGVGRLTIPLAEYFETVLGIDISPTMIELAGKYNRYPDRVHYLINQEDNLNILKSDTLDFIYTNIVLQHIPTDITLGYLAEFLRVLKPEGILVFQLPSHIRPEYLSRSARKAIPDKACRANILALNPPTTLPPSHTVNLAVKITNRSRYDWKQSGKVRLNLGNHWLTVEGKLLIRDDGRSPLPPVVRAGGETTVILPITTPEDEGDYQCELDLVQEMVTWFKDRGSPTGRFAVRVEPKIPSLPEPGEPRPFSMFGIKKKNVVRFIRKKNAVMLSIDEDLSCGREWVGYRYYVRKR